MEEVTNKEKEQILKTVAKHGVQVHMSPAKIVSKKDLFDTIERNLSDESKLIKGHSWADVLTHGIRQNERN